MGVGFRINSLGFEFRGSGLGLGMNISGSKAGAVTCLVLDSITTTPENEMEKKMENDMETGLP